MSQHTHVNIHLHTFVQGLKSKRRFTVVPHTVERFSKHFTSVSGGIDSDTLGVSGGQDLLYIPWDNAFKPVTCATRCELLTHNK